MGSVNEKLGDLESYKLTGWNANLQAGIGSNSGTYYTLTYEVQYSKHSAVEVFTLFCKNSKDKVLITGHTIDSDGFLKD